MSPTSGRPVLAPAKSPGVRRRVTEGVLQTVVALLAITLGIGIGLAGCASEEAPRAEPVGGSVDPPRDTEGPKAGAAAADEPLSCPQAGFIGSSDALDGRRFEGTDVGGLSALTYDSHQDVYYSLVDRQKDTPARFYTLRLPLDQAKLGEPEISGVTVLRDPEGRPFKEGDFDGEGIAVASGGELFVSSETEPSIRRFSVDGGFLAELPVPQKFLVEPRGQAQANSTLEGLALSPDGSSLFTATQKPLTPDGQSSKKQNRIRMLRYADQGTAGYLPAEEFFYLTEPNETLADVAAVSETELLVLERGNRVFRVSLAGAEDVSNQKTLASPGLEPLEKELLVDLNDCSVDGAGGSLSDNYEGLALGPPLPGGRRALLLQSDDGFRAVRVTRLVALGIRP